MRLGWLIHPRNLVVYAVVAIAWLLTARLGLDRWTVGGVLLVLLLLHYFLLPAVALRGLGPFDEKLRKLLYAGKPDELVRFYRSHLFLRAYTPPGVMKHRLGQIHVARRAWEAAFQAYHEALQGVPSADRYAMETGYAEAGFHVGEDGAILPVLGKLARDERTQPLTLFLLAHVEISDPDRRTHARRALKMLTRSASGADVSLVTLAQAEMLGAEGKHERAQELVEELDDASLPDTLQALAPLLRGKLLHVRGKRGSARKLFEKVRRDGRCGRAQLELGEFLDEDRDQ